MAAFLIQGSSQPSLFPNKLSYIPRKEIILAGGQPEVPQPPFRIEANNTTT
jgi:hypothetical protein